jgi:putative ABC transport system permease protein
MNGFFRSNPTLVTIGALFVLAYGTLAIIALRRPLLMRIAWREAIRRPGQSALIVAGLAIAGSSIAAALITGDLFSEWLTSNVVRQWGRVDVLVTAGGAPFPRSVATQLAQDPSLTGKVAGIQAGVELTGAVGDLDQRLGRSGIRLVGFDPAAQQPFGAFVLADGNQTLGDSLVANQVLLSRNLAEELNARIGDRLHLAADVDGVDRTADVTVAGVAAPEGAGLYGLAPSVFATLDAIRPLMGSDAINVIRISAPGSGQQEVDRSRALAPLLTAALGAQGTGYQVQLAKSGDLDAATVQSAVDRGEWLVLSLLAVIAALVLAINLAVALAAERRPRLAMLRAMGLNRRGLVQTAALEGALYSLAGAALSAGPGVLVGLVIGLEFSRFSIIGPGPDQRVAGADLVFALPVKVSTVAFGIMLAALLVLGTVMVTAIRTSRMTIVSAIRNLPEPLPAAGWHWSSILGFGSLALGGLVAVILPSPGESPGLYQLFGGLALIVVAARVSRPLVPQSLRLTLAGVAILAWSIAWEIAYNTVPFMAMLTSVLGIALVAVANLRLLDTALGVLARRAALVAIARPSLAYLIRRPFRTGLSIVGFGLLVMMIVVFAVLLTGSAVYLSRPPAYDVRVTSTGAAAVTLPASAASQVQRQLAVPTAIYEGPLHTIYGNARTHATLTLYALTPQFLAHPPVSMRARFGYPTDASIWQAMMDNPGLAVTANNPGPWMVLAGPNGTVHLSVAGITAPVLAPASVLDGVIVSPATFDALAGHSRGVTLLLKLQPGADPRAVANAITRSLFWAGVQAVPTTAVFAVPVQAVHAVRLALQVFLSLGLLTGVLTLGILALRAVIERRPVIGLLRALGFRRRQVFAGQFIENGMTATIGIALGLVLGAYWGSGAVEAIVSPGLGLSLGLTFDWLGLVVILALVYGTLALVTAIPASLAGRLPPAQALRLTE